MVEGGTLGLERAQSSSGLGASKDQLQRQMEVARESISHTVDEIKDTVVQQYEAVKETISETLDWREQVKKRPVTWSASAIGAGFVVGYGIAAVVKGDGNGSADRYHEERAKTAGVATAAASPRQALARRDTSEEESGPGLIDQFKETQAYGRLKQEAATVGNRFVDEVSKKAQEILLPAALGLVASWLERLVSEKKPGSTNPTGTNRVAAA